MSLPDRDIIWMSSPLGIDQREAILKKFPMIKGTRLDPKEKQTHIFQNIRHWTLQIGDQCHELWPCLGFGAKFGKFTDFIGGNTCKPRSVSAAEWLHNKEVKQKVKVERRRVGQTKLSDRKIKAAVDKLWDEFHGKWYGFFTQNCQNFASLLFVAVATKVPDAEETLWERIPDPAVYTLAKVSKVSLAGQLVLTTWSAGIAAMSAPHALAVGAVTAAAATHAQRLGAGATSGSHAGVVGVAGSQASAASAAATTHSGATAAAVATSTHATAGAVAVGSMQSSTSTVAIAVKGSTAIGSTSVAAGKAGGVSAKLAAAGHGALPKAALLAAKGLAFANPVAAVGGIAVTGYLHHKYRNHRQFKKRMQAHGNEAGTDEAFSMERMLVNEDKLFEEAEKEPEDADGEFEAELCESLELSLVSTEPTEMPDQAVKISRTPDEGKPPPIPPRPSKSRHPRLPDRPPTLPDRRMIQPLA